MKINKLLKYIAFALPAVALLSACDEVDINERYVQTLPVNVASTVLLEDYTGQNCINCPEAHERIDSLVKRYGDNLIPVSIHAGGLAIDQRYTSYDRNYIGLMTTEGSEYDTRYNTMNSWPAGTVNRSNAMNSTSWAAAIKTAIEKEAPLNISLDVALDDSIISISTSLQPAQDLDGKLQLWITEDSIVARQRLPSTTDLNYVHNHVFRTSVNGTWGEDAKLTAGIHSDLNHTIKVRYTDKERWNVNNLSVVAFYYNEGGVLQAARRKVVSTGD